MIEDYMSLKNEEVYMNIISYIFKEHTEKSFDHFWIVCILFYCFYSHHFTIHFDKFFENMLEMKVSIKFCVKLFIY